MTARSLVAAVPLLLGLSAARSLRAAPAPWEWHLSGGGQVDSDSHGVVNFGMRKGPLSIELYTDTLEIRYAPELQKGRLFVAARAEALLAGLLLAPWHDGAPDASRGYFASYAGVEAGYVRYLPRGFYAGVAGAARVYLFNASPWTQVPVPDVTPLVTADAVLGYYDAPLHVWVRAGVDVQGLSPAPHIVGELSYRPQAPLAPIFELRAGAATGQTELTRTRLGGENPYVIPLAGAGWGEFHVSNYAAGRIGMVWSSKWTQLGAVLDAAAFDEHISTGTALLVGAHYKQYFIDGSVGYAPWIQRQPGVSRVSGWLELGVRWGAIAHKAPAPTGK